MTHTNSFILAGLVAVVLTACSQEGGPRTAANEDKTQEPGTAALPPPVNGWIEHPLKDGIIKTHATQWRTDTVEIPVPANGGDLEYKLAMKQGEAIVYSIDYGKLDDTGVIVSEFHGHTEKRSDGVGDLMFYSKTGGEAQHGQFVAPWDGVHGWYLKNESKKDAIVTLKLAGFYALVGE